MGRLYSGSWCIPRCVVSLIVYMPRRIPHRRRRSLVGLGGRQSTNLCLVGYPQPYSPPAAVATLSSAWPRRGCAACSMRRRLIWQCVVRCYGQCRTTSFAQTYHALPCDFRGGTELKPTVAREARLAHP